jgi:hypothetical protein
VYDRNHTTTNVIVPYPATRVDQPMLLLAFWLQLVFQPIQQNKQLRDGGEGVKQGTAQR